MAVISRCMLGVMVISGVLGLVSYSTAHVVLTYPIARTYRMDFLNNKQTPAPCGMPKGRSNTINVLF